MKNLILLLFAVLLLLPPPVSGSEPEAYFERLVENRIDQCRIKADLLRSGGENCRQMSQKAAEQAEFLEQNKDRLVREMVDQGVGMADYKVSYYLIKSYRRHGH